MTAFHSADSNVFDMSQRRFRRSSTLSYMMVGGGRRSSSGGGGRRSSSGGGGRRSPDVDDINADARDPRLCDKQKKAYLDHTYGQGKTLNSNLTTMNQDECHYPGVGSKETSRYEAFQTEDEVKHTGSDFNTVPVEHVPNTTDI